MIDLLPDKYIIEYPTKCKYSLFTSRLQTETCSVAFGIFRECGTIFYRVRYGAVRCIHLVIPNNSGSASLPDKKKIRVSYFFMRNPYMKFQNPSLHGS